MRELVSADRHEVPVAEQDVGGLVDRKVKSRALRPRLPLAARSALTVGLRSSSATLTKLKNGSRSWLSAGTELCSLPRPRQVAPQVAVGDVGKLTASRRAVEQTGHARKCVRYRCNLREGGAERRGDVARREQGPHPRLCPGGQARDLDAPLGDPVEERVAPRGALHEPVVVAEDRVPGEAP